MSSSVHPDTSLKPGEGWHCCHLFYRFDRPRLRSLGRSEIADGCGGFVAALDPEAPEAPKRMQSFLVSGQKADFGLLLMDPNPLVIDGVHQRLMSGLLGPALEPSWSFVSMTEVSEYVPGMEEYEKRLVAEGLDPSGEEFATKRKQYHRRLEVGRRQRLEPDLPAWPALCFYPMNKKRSEGENWYLLDFARRQQLMEQHGATGMTFAGKVTQLVTVALGLDDWEWGVTLWARNPQFLKEIVYRMRFDEASARYAEFGPFYAGYRAGAEGILRHCGVEG